MLGHVCLLVTHNSDSNPQCMDEFLHIRSETDDEHANLNLASKGWG